MPRVRHRETAERSAVGSAVRAAARFDRSVVSFSAGLQAAIPVVTVLGVGIALGYPVQAATMGAGAMLVGIAWRVRGGRPPLALMAVDASIMALSTFVGSVAGSILWVHLIVLCLWSVAGGLLVGVGNQGGVVGNQAIIAVVVFGRFSQPAAQALGLAGLVLIGGLAQVVFLSVIRWPLPLRAQRHATARAYRKLAELAAAEGKPSTLPAGTALDDAADSLSSGALLGDAAMMMLRALVSEGQRLRVQLMALGTLRQRKQSEKVALDAALYLTASALGEAADAIDGDCDAARLLPEIVGQLSETADREAAAHAADAVSPYVAPRLRALAGQLRAIATLAPAAGRGGGLRSRRPYGRTGRPVHRITADLAQAGRQRLARVAGVAPCAAPGSRRPAGNAPGAGTAAGAQLLGRGGSGHRPSPRVRRDVHPGHRTRGRRRGRRRTGGRYCRCSPSGRRSHRRARGRSRLARVLIFPGQLRRRLRLHHRARRVPAECGKSGHAEHSGRPAARHIDRRCAWPARLRALADVVTGTGVAIAGRPRRRRARLLRCGAGRAARRPPRPRGGRAAACPPRPPHTRTQAEAIVARSQSEPATRRIDARRSQAALAALRRLVESAHVLGLDVQEDTQRRPRPEIGPVESALNELLQMVEDRLRALPAESPRAAPAPDLRGRFWVARRAWKDHPETRALANELDEIVDAANGLAAVAGLHPDEAEPATRAPHGESVAKALRFSPS